SPSGASMSHCPLKWLSMRPLGKFHAGSWPGLSLTSRGASAVLHLHAHLRQEIVQGALLRVPVHEIIERHQGATLPSGNLHIMKDIPTRVQHGAADEILADGHWAEVVNAHQALVEYQPIYPLFGRVSPLEGAGLGTRQEVLNKFSEFRAHGVAPFVGSWCSRPPSASRSRIRSSS